MLHDLRHAFRSLAKTPGFVLVAALCLGLALALNTTTFAILDAMLHPTLPVERGDELHEVVLRGRGVAARAQDWEVYSILRQATFYQDIAFWSFGPSATVRMGDVVSERSVPRVSRNLYPMMGVRPEIGRVIDGSSPDNVAVVSHDVWERSLGGAPLGGLTIWIAGQAYQVIGVLPPDMTYPAGWGGGVWIPVPRARERSGVGLGIVLLVRVRCGTTGVTKQLAVLSGRLRAEYGTSWNPYVLTLHGILPPPEQLDQIHFALAGGAAIILLIACVNLASLMLVRGVVKRRELALRMALGAGRATLVRQLLVEGALITGVGAVLGIVLTVWAVPLLHSRIPNYVVNVGRIPLHPSWRVFVFGLGLAGATLLLFGLWPALRASDVDVSEPLKENSAAAIGRRHWRYSPLVIAEVGLSLVLLMGATLLVKAAERQSSTPLGYDRTGLLDARFWLGQRVADSSAARIAYNIVTRIRALPGVRGAAATGVGPNMSPNGVAMSEAYDGTNGLITRAGGGAVGEGFFSTFGIPILRGRTFLPGDERDSAVIVDELAARNLWPDGRAVGRRVKLGGPDSHRLWHRVVGVVRTANVEGPPSDPYLQPQGAIYVAWAPRSRFLEVVIRTKHLDAARSAALRESIRQTTPPGGRVYLWPWLLNFDTWMRAQYFLVKIFSSFSAFALLLAAVGLYGVVSYSVAQRMREFAVRLAVGAPPADVAKRVAHDAAVMVLAGTGVGAFVAMWASSLLGDWLWTVYHTDAVALVIAEAVLLVVGLAAALQPGLRAMRANPVEILRAI